MTEDLVYLYGVVPADAPEPAPGDLVGVEDAPVRLLRLEKIAAPVSNVAASLYADDSLDSHLDDLDWVGSRGLAHERVLDWFAERVPVVPLSLFSLHKDESHVRARLEDDAERLDDLLRHLVGRREWGVKLWRHNAAIIERLDDLSPTLRSLSREMESAPNGRRFLLEKKREALRDDELRRASAKMVHAILASLRERADRSTSMPLPTSSTQSGRILVLHAAFLLTEQGFPAFQERLGQLAHEFQPYGFEFEFTGPWPPYHFVEPDAV